MANDKSGRKKSSKVLAILITLAIVLTVVMDIRDSISNETPKETVAQTTIQATTATEETSVTEATTESVLGVKEELVVHMIDVGQADCFLLIQEDKTALIDCGTRSTGKTAVKYLQDLGITHLDYVIGTHPHDDHMGGMQDILTNFEVETVIIPDLKDAEITANWYMKLLQTFKTGNSKVENPKMGDMYNLGEATMQVLAAETDVKGNTNNYSIVLKVSLGTMDIIMTGDAETEIEELILQSGFDVDAEILKMGHHGSDTSNCEEFLDAVSPDYVLISCKVGNKYEHPIKSTMENLEVRNIEVYRTDENGSVIITITSSEIRFDCEPGDYLCGVELEERAGK